eukprot:g197.t1
MDSDLEHARARVTQLERKVLELEDEADLLACEMERLRTENTELRARNQALTSSTGHEAPLPPASATATGGNDALSCQAARSVVEEDVVEPGRLPDSAFATAITLSHWHSGTNCICVALAPARAHVLASGGVDKAVRLSEWRTGKLLGTVILSAPILSLEFCPLPHTQQATSNPPGSVVAHPACPAPTSTHTVDLIATCMDGTHHLMHACIPPAYNLRGALSVDKHEGEGQGHGSTMSEDGRTNICPEMVYTRPVQAGASLQLAQSWANHSKYVVQAKWTACGTCFATASHDKSVLIFRRRHALDAPDAAATQTDLFTQEHQLLFKNCVEALEVLGTVLVVSVRGDNYLHCADLSGTSDRGGSIADGDDDYAIDGASLRRWKRNMNERGDDHVSFSVLHLSASPDGRHLLAATDKSRHILFDATTLAATNTAPSGAALRIVRNFYGHRADEYSQPRAAWMQSGTFLLSTSQEDNRVHVWCAASGKLVRTLDGHSKLVRDLACASLSLDPRQAPEQCEKMADLDDKDRAVQGCVLATASYDKDVRCILATWKTEA